MSKRIAQHQAEKGDEAQAIGRSRGGRISKVHMLADDRGRPVAIGLTPGNIAQITMAKQLLDAVAPPRRLIAEKAYDADHFRSWLQKRDAAAVIPSNWTRTKPDPLDRRAYKRRNVVERLFGRLKNWWCIAPRYDRPARSYIAAIALVATVAEWLK